MKNNKGFTLIELLVVIAIIGILAVVAVPALFKNIDKAKSSEIESDYSAIRSAALSYYAENGSLDQIKIEDLEQYLERDFNRETPLGGYYQLFSNYDLNNEIPNTNSDYWKGRLVKLKENKLVYGNTVKLKEEGSLFIGIRDVPASKDRLTKLIKDLGEGIVYVYDSSQTYKHNIVYLKILDK